MPFPLRLLLAIALSASPLEANDETRLHAAAEPTPAPSPTPGAPTSQAIEVTEDAPRRPSPADTSPVATTRIDLDASPLHTATLGEHLSLSPGLQVNRLGGPGAYATVLVRGASSGQMAVFLDGVPLTHPAIGDVNLEDLPLDALEAIELYRGNSPVAFGADAIGGVLNLVSRAPTRPLEARFRLSTGAFGYRRLAAGFGLLSGPWETQLSLGARDATGDFPYYDDFGTPYNGADDRVRTRQNNDVEAAEATARARYRGDGPDVTLQASGVWKAHGLPGVGATRPTTRARYETGWAAAYARVEGRFGQARIDGLADVAWRTQHLSDPLGEVGFTPRDTRDATTSLGLSTRADVVLSPHLGLELVGIVRDDRYHPEAAADQARLRLGLGAELAFCFTRLSILPAVLFDHFIPRSSQAVGGTGEAMTAGSPTASSLASPRLGLELTPAAALPALKVRANGGLFHRAPTFYELYGQGAIDANPDLESERGLNLDIGAVLEPRLATGGLRLELIGFHSRVDDLIVLVQNSQRTVRPENVDGQAVMTGIEGLAEARWGEAGSLSAAYTFLDAGLEGTGRQLPGRPRHSLKGLLTLGTGWLRGYYRIDATSGAFLDTFNTRPIPPRTLHDLGLTARVRAGTHEQLEASIEVRNLLNVFYQTVDYAETPQMVADFIGYPLPGRAVYLTIAWRR